MLIERAAVLGAGVMGAAIAAHLANVGISCLLLDLAPGQGTKAREGEAGTETAAGARNDLAARALARLFETKPSPFYTRKRASLIRVGNFEDHLGLLSEVDWVVEAVVENLKVKQELLARAEKFTKPDCIFSTNTSGLSVRAIAAPLGLQSRSHFLGAHFFNPPRYMNLLELVPLPETSREVVEYMETFCGDRLGKGVVVSRDVPGFIANRMGGFDLATAIELTVTRGMKIEEVDAVAACLGRPSTAIFGTLDLVGLDVARNIAAYLRQSLPDDALPNLEKSAPFLDAMVGEGRLGNKTGQGFYKKTRGEKGEEQKLVLDYRRMEYRVPDKPAFPSLVQAQKAQGLAERIRTIFTSDDGAGAFARAYLCRNLCYAAAHVLEVCKSIMDIDRAMKWGYNHQLGPFEIWDSLGVRQTVTVMEGLGLVPPARIREMLAARCESFYLRKESGLHAYDFEKGGYRKVEEDPRIIIHPSLADREKAVRRNAGASLYDLGDGIACLAFHTKMNTIDDAVVEMFSESLSIVEKDFLGLVIGNNDVHFSAGANIARLLSFCREGNWETIDRMVRLFQDVNMRLKYLSKPVVAAPTGLTLGGGCEIAMHASHCRPSAETYMGLVEVGVGLIPAAGGSKEMMLRLTEGIPDGLVEAGLNLQHFYLKAFETIAKARVSGSAYEAMELGYLRKKECISINRDRQLWEAKQTALAMARCYRKPEADLIPVMGENFRGLAEAILSNMRQGNYLSEYDVHVAKKVAAVLSGGDCPEGTLVTEREILDREREAFLSLCGEPKTQERIAYTLETGKPLRN